LIISGSWGKDEENIPVIGLDDASTEN
jgi:hypothetical protein